MRGWGNLALKNEPKKHHYIPQFILRNFRIGDSDEFFYQDIKTRVVQKKKAKDIFMVRYFIVMKTTEMTP